MTAFAGNAFKSLSGLLKSGGSAALKMGSKPLGTGKFGAAVKGVGFDFSNPMTALGVGVPTAMLAGQLGKGIGSAVKEEFVGLDRDIQEELKRQRYMAAQRFKSQRLQAAMADNMMRLAAANPHLYNQLLVGRVLPQGAVVLGGGQKSDFLESVAYQMATGGFETPTGTPDSPDVMQTLVDSY